MTRPVPCADQQAVDYVLRLLADADLLDVETTNALGHVIRWLLVPVGYAELEFLAAFRADDEDREDGHDAEDDEEEPNVTSPASMQRALRLADERMTVREWREDMPPVLEAAD